MVRLGDLVRPRRPGQPEDREPSLAQPEQLGLAGATADLADEPLQLAERLRRVDPLLPVVGGQLQAATPEVPSTGRALNPATQKEAGRAGSGSCPLPRH